MSFDSWLVPRSLKDAMKGSPPYAQRLSYSRSRSSEVKSSAGSSFARVFSPNAIWLARSLQIRWLMYLPVTQTEQEGISRADIETLRAKSWAS